MVSVYLVDLSFIMFIARLFCHKNSLLLSVVNSNEAPKFSMDSCRVKFLSNGFGVLLEDLGFFFCCL